MTKLSVIQRHLPEYNSSNSDFSGIVLHMAFPTAPQITSFLMLGE